MWKGNGNVWRRLYRVFTYIYSLLIEKNIRDCRNVSVKLPCVYMCLSSGDPFNFSMRVSSFFFFLFTITRSFEIETYYAFEFPKIISGQCDYKNS